LKGLSGLCSIERNFVRISIDRFVREIIMDNPFPKSVSAAEKVKRLLSLVSSEDTLAILINADPDAIASALALKRIFWRRVKKTWIYRINVIKRADNLAMVKLLKVDNPHIRKMNASEITRWAIVDSQPHHDPIFQKHEFQIVIDHHPFDPDLRADFIDIKEDYGATSTLLIEYLRALKIKPSPRLATALFYGIKTDTENFARPTTSNDINAFRYLYPFVNTHIIKKIESSELTKKSLDRFRDALDRFELVKNRGFVHMGRVNDPDLLVMIADFFLKVAEASWSIVSGLYGHKLIIIFRNAGFRRDAGKMAQKLFGEWGNAGGHKNAARAEILLQDLEKEVSQEDELRDFVLERIRMM
jgi:nanoRNase/pAp phosphatase (c-di-AMP/oligoRNAs hydrolase)